MNLYVAKTDHIQINEVDPERINLNDLSVIGISIENLSDSSDDLMFGLNEGAKISIAPGDSRNYGGFHANNMPLLYTGYINIKFPDTATAPKALVIITYITPETKQLC